MGNDIINRVVRKAKTSPCNYRVGAIALNKRGRILAFSRNTPRFSKEGGSIHAEMHLMKIYGNRISKIYILRVGKGGEVKGMDPCKVCQKKADELGIKIVNIFAE